MGTKPVYKVFRAAACAYRLTTALFALMARQRLTHAAAIAAAARPCAELQARPWALNFKPVRRPEAGARRPAFSSRDGRTRDRKER